MIRCIGTNLHVTQCTWSQVNKGISGEKIIVSIYGVGLGSEKK